MLYEKITAQLGSHSLEILEQVRLVQSLRPSLLGLKADGRTTALHLIHRGILIPPRIEGIISTELAATI